eukprot:scaffold1086_cov143-Skeletonema_marinoi.AAC.5
MSRFGDHKPEKLKKNEYQAKVKAPKKKGGDRKKSAATLVVERDEILQNANEQLGDGNVRLLESNESQLALYGVCKEAVEKSQKQHKQAKSLQTNNMQAHKKIASLEKKLDAKDGTIRKLNIDVTTQKEKKKSAEDEKKDNEKLRNDAALKSGADGAAKSNSLQEKLQYELHKGVMQNMLKNEQERNKMENKNKRLATIASGGGILSGGGALSLPTGSLGWLTAAIFHAMSQMNDKNSPREDDNVDPGMYVSPGSIKTMFGMSGATDKPGFQPTVQVLHLKDISHADAANKRWKVTISDGTHYFSGVVAHQLAQMVDSGDITQHAIKSISKGDVCICINKGNV